MDTFIEDTDPAFEKLLSDNRERYIQQSSNTRCGQVAPLPTRDKSAEKPNYPKPHAWLFRDLSVLEFPVATRTA